MRKKRPEYNSTTVQPFTLDTTSTDESHNNNNNNFVTEVTSESYKFVETILNTTTTSSTKDFKEIVGMHYSYFNEFHVNAWVCMCVGACVRIMFLFIF